MSKHLLLPAVVLVLWSLFMLGWVVLTRLPALKAKGVNINTAVGGKGSDLDGVLDAKVMWPAHNHNHLMEQPTLFYATVGALAIMGAATTINIYLAWGYVALRIVHSLVQATYNKISHRFPIFVLATATLLWLAVNALLEAIKA